MILPDIEPPLPIHVVNLAKMESPVVEIKIPYLQAQKTMPAVHLHGLRRRAVGAGPRPEPHESPRDQSPVKPGDKVKIIHHHSEKPPPRKKKNTVIFLLGSIFGLLAAGFLARSNDLIEFPEFGDLSVDTLLDVLPAGFVTDEMRDLVVCQRLLKILESELTS